MRPGLGTDRTQALVLQQPTRTRHVIEHNLDAVAAERGHRARLTAGAVDQLDSVTYSKIRRHIRSVLKVPVSMSLVLFVFMGEFCLYKSFRMSKGTDFAQGDKNVRLALVCPLLVHFVLFVVLAPISVKPPDPAAGEGRRFAMLDSEFDLCSP